MTPLEFLHRHYVPSRLLTRSSLGGYERAASAVSSPIETFTARTITEYASQAIRQGLSPHTVKARCVILVCLWRMAHELGISRSGPTHVTMPKCPRKIIRAIPPDSLSRLLDHCEHLPGCLKTTRIPRSHYWSAFVAASYETALRTSDIRQLRWDSSGRWHLIQVKTRRPVTVQVSSTTLELLGRLSKSSPKLLDMGWAREWYCRGLQRIAAQIGLRISPQQLRQSAASEAERLQPGTAWILLGHSSPATCQRWYIDADHAYRDLPRPRIRPEKKS